MNPAIASRYRARLRKAERRSAGIISKQGRNARGDGLALSINETDESATLSSLAASWLNSAAAEAYWSGVKYCACRSSAACRRAQETKCEWRRTSSAHAASSGFDCERNCVSARLNSTTVHRGETFWAPV